MKKITTGEIKRIVDELGNKKENLVIEIEGNKLTFSHLDKAFWPKYGSHAAIAKRDYLIYLTKVSPWLLPHVRDRPITLIRFPAGISGHEFFQKHWDGRLPDFVETVAEYTEHLDIDQTFLLCNNLSTLLWLGQIADLELHTTHARINKSPDAKRLTAPFTGSVKNIESSVLNYPDYMVFDLDPYLYSGKEKKGAEPELHKKGFRQAAQVAVWLKELLDKLGLYACIKTSGRTGLHIYVPIKRNIVYDDVRAFSQIIGQHLLSKHPDMITMDWSVKERTGKVFFDHNMNARSKSLASIYSPRISKDATVSTPIEWHELNKVYPADFNIDTVPDRLKKHGDLWSDILDNKNDLLALAKKNVLGLSKPTVKKRKR